MFRKIERFFEDMSLWRQAAREGLRVPMRAEVTAWRDLPISEQIERNREHVERLVVPWDSLVSQPLNRPGKHPLIFLHIPKAAGSTFDNVIPKNYDINGVIHINTPQFYMNPGALLKEGSFPRAAMGHFKFNQYVYQMVKDPFIHVTILREPVARLISFYNFLLAAPRHGRHKRAATMSFEDFVESKTNHECHNGQALRITGHLNRRYLQRPLPTDEVLQLAQEALLKRFTFFGLTERYPEFMLTCHRLMGWHNLYYAKKKVTRDTPKRISRKDLSDAAINRARELNEVDVRLYEWATGLVEERCREIGITPELAQEFERRNKEYQELTHRPYFSSPKRTKKKRKKEPDAMARKRSRAERVEARRKRREISAAAKAAAAATAQHAAPSPPAEEQ